MQAFQTKGVVAEWRMIYDHISTLDIGDIVTFEDLSGILGRDILTNRSPIYRAQSEFLKANSRLIVSVPTIGYRIAEPVEHAGQARSRHRRGRRQLVKGRAVAVHADRSFLSAEEIKRIDNIEQALSSQVDITRRLEVRVTSVEKAVEAATSKAELTAEETQSRVERLEAALQRHGILTNPGTPS